MPYIDMDKTQEGFEMFQITSKNFERYTKWQADKTILACDL